MNKISIAFLEFVVFVTMVFATAPVKAEYCNQGITAKLINLGGGGQPATVSITNTANCAAQATAASYKVYRQPYVESGWLDTQTLLDYETVILSPSETRTISLDTADCMTQVDVFRGGVVYKLYDYLYDYYTTIVPLGELTHDPVCAMCQNQCVLNTHECSGSSGRTCVQSGQCTAWGTWQTCDSQCHSCGDGRCECGETKASCSQDCGYNTPTVNLDQYFDKNDYNFKLNGGKMKLKYVTSPI